MARTPIIAGNWKMHTTIAEGLALVDAMLPTLQSIETVERVLCPPFTSLAPIRDRLHGTALLLGAQNVHPEEQGAFTGEVSPLMLQGLVDYVIVGHSERRKYFGETDDFVARKVRSALGHGLKPILCVGENLEENEAGQTMAVVERQVRAALAGLDSIEGLVIAYEPVWAIGTGRPATAEGANAVIGAIRGLVADLHGRAAAERLRIQYGGSVSPENFPAFIEQPEIDGALVGGASLKAAAFVQIVRQAEVKAGR